MSVARKRVTATSEESLKQMMKGVPVSTLTYTSAQNYSGETSKINEGEAAKAAET